MTDLRALVAAQLPQDAFLRRDRGNALYVTNAPAKGWSGEIDGFLVEADGAIARITPDYGTMQRCGYASDRLAQELERFRGASPEVLEIFTACMKCAEAPDGAAYDKCDRALRQAAAVAMRNGGGEGLYYCALALAEARRRLDEKNGGK